MKIIRSDYKSDLEFWVANSLNDNGYEFIYEAVGLTYYVKNKKGMCRECGSEDVYEEHTYTPDFWLPDYGFYIETKGKWVQQGRTMHLNIQKYNPKWDIRFIFQRDNWLTKKKKTKYSDWCRQKGFKCFTINEKEKRYIPNEWFDK